MIPSHFFLLISFYILLCLYRCNYNAHIFRLLYGFLNFKILKQIKQRFKCKRHKMKSLLTTTSQLSIISFPILPPIFYKYASICLHISPHFFIQMVTYYRYFCDFVFFCLFVFFFTQSKSVHISLQRAFLFIFFKGLYGMLQYEFILKFLTSLLLTGIQVVYNLLLYKQCCNK